MENPFATILKELEELKGMVSALQDWRVEKAMPPAESDFMQLADAAQLLGISKSTLYKYSCSRQSPFTFYKVGKRLFCKRSELLIYMNGSKLASVESYANHRLSARK